MNPAAEVKAGAVRVTPEQMESYLARLAGKGYSSGTIQSYRRNLQLFFKEYPSGEIRPDSAARWREKLLAQGLMPSTVKLRISSVNGLLAFLELWKYQAKPPPWPNTEEVQPELTRSEYLRLLSAARALGKEQVYLLVKVFACTGVRVQDLPQVTVEAVQEGRLLLHKQLVSLPPSLCDELLSYAGKKGVSHGSLFVTRNGKPLSRTNVTALVQRLAGTARVSPEKCNPRCLRKLYQETLRGIQQNVAVLIEQAHQRLVEQEQIRVGWKETSEVTSFYKLR